MQPAPIKKGSILSSWVPCALCLSEAHTRARSAAGEAVVQLRGAGTARVSLPSSVGRACLAEATRDTGSFCSEQRRLGVPLAIVLPLGGVAGSSLDLSHLLPAPKLYTAMTLVLNSYFLPFLGSNIEAHGPHGRSKPTTNFCKCSYVSYKFHFSK